MGILKKKRKKEKSDYESGHASDFYGSFSDERALKKAAKEAAEVEKKFTNVIKDKK